MIEKRKYSKTANKKNGNTDYKRSGDIKINGVKTENHDGDDEKPIKSDDNAETSNRVIGRNAVIELLKLCDDTRIDKIFIKSGQYEGSLKVIAAEAARLKIPMVEAGQDKLNELAGGTSHQGVIAITTEKAYCTIDDILKIAEERGEKPFIVICDGIEDPYNLGAVIRSAECAGVHGIIIPKRRAVGLSASVSKSSAGAIEHMAVARVPNLANAIDELKEKGLWIYAAEKGGEPYYKCDLSSPTALIMGGEDSGVSRLLKEKSDVIISIPLHGKITSLNVSAAAAVLMNEVAKQHSES